MTCRRLILLLLLAPLAAWAEMPALGERAPKFVLRDLDGARVRFPGDAGSAPAVLLFWGTWCPYCKALMAPLTELAAERGDALGIYAVDFGEQGDVSAILRAMELPFVVLPRGDSVARRYAIERVPAMFLVRDGRIVHRLEHPPSDHPSRAGARGHAQAAGLARWWVDELRAALGAVSHEQP